MTKLTGSNAFDYFSALPNSELARDVAEVTSLRQLVQVARTAVAVAADRSANWPAHRKELVGHLKTLQDRMTPLAASVETDADDDVSLTIALAKKSNGASRLHFALLDSGLIYVSIDIAGADAIDMGPIAGADITEAFVEEIVVSFLQRVLTASWAVDVGRPLRAPDMSRASAGGGGHGT